MASRKLVHLTVPLALSLSLLSTPAWAYRPFQGTDADVAELGEFELELGPVNYVQEQHLKSLVAPATVLNFGILPSWELVFDASNFVRVSSGDTPRLRLLDTDVLLKALLVPGALQGEKGLSVATEFGVLTPELHGDQHFGAIDTLIISFRNEATTIHLNNGISLSRAHNAEYTGSIILEGPHEWPVRPVTELLVDREHDGVREDAALLGLIWEVGDQLAIDGALRGALVNDLPVREVRAGLTWATEMWSVAKAK